MPCTCFAGTRLREVQKEKPSLRRYYLMLNEKITKQKTYQMPVYFFALLGFFCQSCNWSTCGLYCFVLWMVTHQ